MEIYSQVKVDSWVGAHASGIHQTLTYYRAQRVEEALKNHDSIALFDSEAFTLAEMPLCRAWHFIDPPPGFIRNYNGGIRLDDIGSTAHVYAFRGPEILCFTFAQLYDLQHFDRREEVPRGGRVRYYHELALDLVRIVEIEAGVYLAYLHGDRKVIHSRLGLQYV